MSCIVVIETFSGLCNQFMDIIASVAFAQENNLRFCFKSSASRNQDLTSWSPEPFSFLFDESPYASLDGYVGFKDVNMDSHTIWNGDSKRIPEYGLDYAQLVAISGRYERLVLKQVWPLLDWESSANVVRKVPRPAPSENVLKVFGQVRARLPSEYNFLAYRYEHDFVNFFTKNYPGTNFPLLKEILALEPFSDPSLSTYLAC